jgi:glutathione S-transferase
MLTLYYYPLCPLSQKIHLILKIWQIPHEKIQITNREIYSQIKNYLKFSPLPLLKIHNEKEDLYLTESLIISNYLNHNYVNQPICFQTQNIEIITDIHFYKDVYMNIVYERTLKTIFSGVQPPNISKIQEGIENSKKYLFYFENILIDYNWLNKFQFSIGDISLFSEIMCLDYCGQMPWLKFPNIKKWYMRIKYRPQVQEVLKEHISIFLPPKHYELLDF